MPEAYCRLKREPFSFLLDLSYRRITLTAMATEDWPVKCRLVGLRPRFRFKSYDINHLPRKQSTEVPEECYEMAASTHSMTTAGTVYDAVGCVGLQH